MLSLLTSFVFSDLTYKIIEEQKKLSIEGSGVITKNFIQTINSSDFEKFNSVYIGPDIYGISKEAFVPFNFNFSVDFANSSKIQIIDDKAFYGTNILSIVLPYSLKEIGEEAFRNTSLENVSYYNTENCELLKIGNRAFSNTKLKSLFIPKFVSIFGSYAFSDNSELTEITYNGSYISNDTTLFDSTGVPYVFVNPDFGSRRFGGLPISKEWPDSATLGLTDWLIIGVIAGVVLAVCIFVIVKKCLELRNDVAAKVDNPQLKSPLVEDNQAENNEQL